jgi:hypothetical protein
MSNLLYLLMGMWDFSGIKNKLLELWVPPETLEDVNFNNIQSLNALAQKIMPWLLANNRQLVGKIKSMSSMLWAEKQKEIWSIIDYL